MARKFGRRVRRRQHGNEEDNEVEETSSTTACSDTDLLMTPSHFQVLSNEEHSEVQFQ